MKVSLFEISQRLLGQPYCLGHPDKGLDCFLLVHRYAQLRGANPPSEFGGLSLLTYGDLYDRDPDGAKALMLDYLASFMDEIPIRRACAGDVLILTLADAGDALPFPAISSGCTAIAAHPERGVCLINLQHYRIERAFRCRPPSQQQ